VLKFNFVLFEISEMFLSTTQQHLRMQGLAKQLLNQIFDEKIFPTLPKIKGKTKKIKKPNPNLLNT